MHRFLLYIWIALTLSPAFASAGLVVNSAPVAVDDETYDTEDVEQTGDVSLNDFDPDGDELFYTLISPPAHGNLILNSDGTYSYIPIPEYVGFDYATYEVCDPSGLCDQAQIEFAMTFVNDWPVAENDFFYCFIGTTLSGTVIENDFEADDEPSWYTVLAPPFNAASFTLNIDGGFSYTPLPGFEGTDTFFYTMCDPCGACAYASVTIEVVQPNEAPTAEDDLAYGTEDFIFNGNVALNDTDDDPSTLVFTLLNQPEHGVVEMNADGTFTLYPELDYFGTDEFQYQVCDFYGQCDTATVFVILSFVNDSPTALDDYFDLNEDEVLTADVTLNDSDPDLEPITWMLWVQPTVGSIQFNSNGTFTYTPPANYHGPVQFTYFMLDPCGYTDTAIAYITVLPVNDAPTAVSEAVSTNEDTPVSGNLGLNDSDIEGDELSWSLLDGPNNGSLDLSSNGDLVYTPNPDYFGADEVNYQVTDVHGASASATLSITVLPVNDAPIALDDHFTGNEDEALSGDVSLNDSDADGDLLNYSFNQGVLNGVFNGNSDGTFEFIPAANYYGSFSISYLACDAEMCIEAILNIEILNINDAPTAQNEAISIDEDSSYSGSVATNDSDVDGDVLSWNVLSGPLYGELIWNSNGEYTYTPFPDFHGEDQMDYEVVDTHGAASSASLSITVNPINDAPIAEDDLFSANEDETISGNISLNDSDVDNETLSYQFFPGSIPGEFIGNSDGSFEFIPDANYYGSFEIAYQACDQELCTDAVLTLELLSVNDTPLPADTAAEGEEDNEITGTLSAIDPDAEPGELLFSLIDLPVNGSILLNPNGQFTYTPDPDYFGNELLTFEVCDAYGACSQAELSIVIHPVNDAPVALNDTAELDEDTILSGSVASNDMDVDDDVLVYSLITNPQNGSFMLSVDGSWTYTPEPNYFGTESLSYEVCDAAGACDTAVLNLSILPVNDAPVAVNDNRTVFMNTTENGNVSLNDSDVDDEFLVYSILTDALNGIFTLQPDGSYTYTPDLNYFGPEVIVYEACDDEGLCDTAQLSIQVVNTNSAPIASNAELNTNEDEELIADLNDFVSDPDGNTLTFTALTQPAVGSLEVDAAGSFSYSAPLDYFGTVSFSFEACDDLGECDAATVTIEVLPVNDAPVAVDDEVVIEEDGQATGNLTANDYDVDDLALTCVFLTDAQNGELSLDDNGNFSYTPDQDYFGIEEISYRICDASDACADATLLIIIEAVNDVPVAVSDAFELEQNTTSEGSVAGNDFDVDDTELSFELLSEAQNGSIQFNPDGSFSYTPFTDWFGQEQLDYQVCDDEGLCATAILSFEVAPVNTAPETISYESSTCVISSVVIDLSQLISDEQESSEELLIEIGSSEFGEISLDGQILTFLAFEDAPETVELSYTVCDSGTPSLCAEGSITLQIEPAFIPELTGVIMESPTCFGETNGFLQPEFETSGFTFEYSWNTGESSPILENLGAGSYSLTLTPTEGCALPHTVEFTLEQPDELLISGLLAEPINDTPGGSNDYAVSGGTGDYSYTWTDAEGNVISSSAQLDGLTDAGQSGSYTLTVTDENGCTVSESILVTGLEEFAAEWNLSIWPNPTTADAMLQLNGLSEPFNVVLYDSAGRRIWLESVAGNGVNTLQIPVSQFESGVYLVEVVSSGLRKSFRLVRQ